MELFDYIAKNVNFGNCETLEEASSRALAALEASGMQAGDVLRQILAELGGKPVDRLLDQFGQLSDGAFFRAAVRDVMVYELIQRSHPTNVADILIGLMLLHARPDLRAPLEQLRSSTLYGDSVYRSFRLAGERPNVVLDIDFGELLALIKV
jgi:hypothetical protein